MRALEIWINGKRLYTVGAEEWRALHAQVWGHRFPADYFTRENWPNEEDRPDADMEHINFHASVATPKAESAMPTNSSAQRSGSLQTHSYLSQSLDVGDEVIIRIVDSSDPDKPNAPKPDPKFPEGAVVIKSLKRQAGD